MKIHFSLKTFVFYLLISFVFIFSQLSEAHENGSKPIGHNNNIIRGIELLYDLEFNRAEKLFHNLISERPEDPEGYFYLAMVPWSQLASGFWTSEKILECGKRTDRAVRVARNKIRNGDADSSAYFYLGGALGFKGRLELMQRNYFSSFLLAREAIRALKACLKMDPNNRDVYLGLGAFDYYTDRLSGILKFLSCFILHKGDKEEGLKKLHIAANEAVYSATEAKSMLLHIYLFLEQNYHEALPLGVKLANSFSKDPRYRYLEGICYIHLGLDQEYRKVLDYFLQKSQQKIVSGQDLIWRNRARYLEVSYFLFHEQYPMARSLLNVVLSNTDPKKDPFMIAWPLLKMGISYDLENERDEALSYYSRILSLKNRAGAQFLAERYIDKPPLKRDPLIGY